MDVLVHILEGGKRGQAFDVDVAIVRRGEPGVVGDDPLVADCSSFNVVRPAIVRARIQGVAFVVDTRVRLEWLRVTFGTLSVIQASVTAGVDHATFHGLEQDGLKLWVWPTCPHCAIDLLRGLDFVLWLE